MASAKTTSLNLDRSLIRPGERLCVAVSGGADSVSLLLWLATTAGELGIGVSAAHVHHGLRGAEADADEAFVRELCVRLGIPLRVFPVDTAARQALEGEGLEEAARALRYEALQSVIADGTADVIATAHTLDDQAETVLMKLLRGAWLEGLAGISPELKSAAHIIRPMLGVRRAEVEAFLRTSGQGWREDSSNADTSLTRNRIRHELVPLLRSFNPTVDAMLAHIAELARVDEAYWRAEVARLRPMLLLPGKPVRGGGRAVGTAVDTAAVAMEVERLRALPEALHARMLREAARTVGARLTFDETAKVLALALSGKPGKKLELRGGLRVERTARELQMWRQS